MKKYEILFIIDKDMTEEKREAGIEKVLNFIKENNGTVENVDKWGMKKYAYPINDKNEGFYCLINFELDPSLLVELDRIMGIDETYVRQMVSNVIENKKTQQAVKAKEAKAQREQAKRDAKLAEDAKRAEEAEKAAAQKAEAVKAEEAKAEAVKTEEAKAAAEAVEAETVQAEEVQAETASEEVQAEEA